MNTWLRRCLKVLAPIMLQVTGNKSTSQSTIRAVGQSVIWEQSPSPDGQAVFTANWWWVGSIQIAYSVTYNDQAANETTAAYVPQETTSDYPYSDAGYVLATCAGTRENYSTVLTSDGYYWACINSGNPVGHLTYYEHWYGYVYTNSAQGFSPDGYALAKSRRTDILPRSLCFHRLRRLSFRLLPHLRPRRCHLKIRRCLSFPVSSTLVGTRVRSPPHSWDLDLDTMGGSASFRIGSGGVIYLGGNDGKLYALRASTGALLWKASMRTSTSIAGTPVVTHDAVYVGSSDHYLYAFNASTGATLWTTREGAVVSAPTVVDGVVYVGAVAGKVSAYNAATGATLWTATAQGNPILFPNPPEETSPAVAKEIVYAGVYGGQLYAYDASTGAVLGTITVGQGFITSPVVVGSILYVGSYDNKLYAFKI